VITSPGTVSLDAVFNWAGATDPLGELLQNSAKHYPSPTEVVELLEDRHIAIQISGTGEGQVSDRLGKGIKRSA